MSDDLSTSGSEIISTASEYAFFFSSYTSVCNLSSISCSILSGKSSFPVFIISSVVIFGLLLSISGFSLLPFNRKTATITATMTKSLSQNNGQRGTIEQGRRNE